MENPQNNIETKRPNLAPIPQEMLLQADFILNEIRKNPKKDKISELESIDLVLGDALAKYNPEKHFEPDQLHYLWKKLKFKIKPLKKSDLENHDRISLARAIYIYSNLLEVYPEGSDRLPLDEAIDKYIGEEIIEDKYMEEATRIFEEAKKFSKKIEKKLRPFDFKFFMNHLNYDEKDTLSILRYFRDLKVTNDTIKLESEKELEMMAKALELHQKKGQYTSIKVEHIGDDTRQNVMMFLTAPETPKKRPDQT